MDARKELALTNRSYVRGTGVGRCLGDGLTLGVGVGVGLGAANPQYLPPVLTAAGLAPPQTIISVPVQTAVGTYRAVGASVVLVAVQLSGSGLYLPPVLKIVGGFHPPQTIISLPVHTAECWNRPLGTLVMLVAFQRSMPGS